MSEYLSDEEQLARLKSWWDEYGTTVIVSLVIAVGGIVGWRVYDGYAGGQVEAASAEYIAYQTADAGTQAELAQAIAESYPGSAYHTLVLFDQAKQALAAGDAAAAASSLQEVVGQSDDALLVDLARVRLAKLQHELDRTDEALANLAAIRHKGYRAWALEAKGDIHMSRDEVALAHEAYAAAQQSLQPGEERPLLKMKLDNAAPFEGEFVQLQDVLQDALRDAEKVLDEQTDNTAAQAAAESPEAADAAADAEAAAAVED